MKVRQSKLYNGRPTKRVQDSEDYKYTSIKRHRFQYSSEGKKEDYKKKEGKKEERRDGGCTMYIDSVI